MKEERKIIIEGKNKEIYGTGASIEEALRNIDKKSKFFLIRSTNKIYSIKENKIHIGEVYYEVLENSFKITLFEN